MRFVDRTQFKPPAFMASPEWEKVCRELEEIHASDSGGRRGKQFVAGFDDLFSPFHSEALSSLSEVFAGKCAYTERPIPSLEEMMFHLHRPGGDAIGLDGSSAPEHYWWLQAEWTNWMLVSPQVVSLKGTNFPVMGERMEYKGTEQEIPLLIDPGSEHPAWWLSIEDDGTVTSRQLESQVLRDRYSGMERGEFNIRALDLNESRLFHDRQKGLEQSGIGSNTSFGDLLDPENAERWLTRTLDPQIPYVGAVRQRLARAFVSYLRDNGGEIHDAGIRLFATALTHEIGAFLCSDPDLAIDLGKRIGRNRLVDLFGDVTKAIREYCPDLISHFVDSDVPDVAAETVDEPGTPADQQVVTVRKPKSRSAAAPRPATPPVVEAVPDPDATIDRHARLREIRIRNFKGIEELTIVIPDGVEAVHVGPLNDRRVRISAVNWKMLLGENACGKSSILQAIALALYGPEIESQQSIRVDRMRRRGIGRKHSYVELEFRGHDRPVKLKLNQGGFAYSSRPDFRLFIRGYGATRLFHSDTDRFDHIEATDRRRVGNLFDPLYPVVDVNTWLMGLDEGDFNVAARAIRNLIAGFGDRQEANRMRADLVRDPHLGEVTLGGDTLDALSDGYRTLLALTCDIMAGLGTGLSDMENAVGIVLIDEIGAHLHPRLRMQVVPRLRYIFPQIQFICSTHEPLCLRGLFESEVDRIRRIDGDVVQETIDRNPSSYRIDQLLTSEFFGLESTIDPELDGQFLHYYHLLNKTELTEDEERDRSRLRNQLITEGVLGYTRRDQLVYEAIDSYLAGRDNRTPATNIKLKRQTIERIKDIWSLAELRQNRQ